MSTQETAVLKRTMVDLSAQGYTLFRNNVGLAWQGKAALRTERDGSTTATIRYAQAVRYGLCNGSSDLIGWRTITIGPELVGHDVALFTAREVKIKRGTISNEQANFIEQVNRAGGDGMVVWGE